MQQVDKKWLAQRAQEILERNTPCNGFATEASTLATTAAARTVHDEDRRKTVFRYWIRGVPQSFIMLSRSTDPDEALDALQAMFADRVTKVDRY